MNLEDFQLLDNEPIDNSVIKRLKETLLKYIIDKVIN